MVAPECPVAYQMYRVPAVAERMGVSKDVIYNMAKRDEIPHLRIGKSIVIPKAEFDAYLARQRAK